MQYKWCFKNLCVGRESILIIKQKAKSWKQRRWFFLLLLFLGCFTENQVPKEEVWNNKARLLDLRLAGSWDSSSRSLPGPICRFYSVALTYVPEKSLALCLNRATSSCTHSHSFGSNAEWSPPVPKSSGGGGNLNHREFIKCLWQATGTSSTFFFHILKYL